MNRRATHHHSGMDWRSLHRLCLSFPGTEETFPFSPGTSVFKVAGKMFALTREADEPLQISLKCEPALAEQLREAHSAVTPGYHLNKRHWNTVVLDGSISDRMLADMVEDSYDLVVSALPRAKRLALGWVGDDRE
jgi:predicted DNA-binding protein (MmcQ/YjbR family)